MRLHSRLVLMLVLLIASQMCAFVVARVGMPTRSALPSVKLEGFPTHLGDWVCIESSPREKHAEVEDIAGAVDSIHRLYRHVGKGVVVSLYAAAWEMDDNLDVLPHEPWLCYPGSGHKIQGFDQTSLTPKSGPAISATLMTTSLDNQPAYILYWYELGDRILTDDLQLRRYRWRFRGKDVWPPMVKVMLDIRGTNGQAAREMLKDLGEKTLDWTSENL